MAPLRMIARPMLASMFVVGGVNALKNTSALAERSRPVAEKVRDRLSASSPTLAKSATPENLVRANAAIQLGAGLALASGRVPRLSAAVLAASLVPTTLGGHRFWEESDPAARANQKIHFTKNVSMLGGLLLAAVDTEGRPGVAWRTRHALHDAQRESRHLRRVAKQQMRIAAASLPTP